MCIKWPPLRISWQNHVYGVHTCVWCLYMCVCVCMVSIRVYGAYTCVYVCVWCPYVCVWCLYVCMCVYGAHMCVNGVCTDIKALLLLVHSVNLTVIKSIKQYLSFFAVGAHPPSTPSPSLYGLSAEKILYEKILYEAPTV